MNFFIGKQWCKIILREKHHMKDIHQKQAVEFVFVLKDTD